MKMIWLDRDLKNEMHYLKTRHAEPSHAIRTIGDRDAVVAAPDGTIEAIFLKQVIKPDWCDAAYADWSQVDDVINNRTAILGSRSVARIKKDGTQSKRAGPEEHLVQRVKDAGGRHGALGYWDATRSSPCQKTPLTLRRPEWLTNHRALIEFVDREYALQVPRIYARQRAEVAHIPNWRLWETVFTTLYLIKLVEARYHTDSGNLRGVLSAIMPLGKFRGGALIIARWGLRVNYTAGDLLYLNPQNPHANLPVESFEGAGRLAAILYCEGRIGECPPCNDCGQFK